MLNINKAQLCAKCITRNSYERNIYITSQLSERKNHTHLVL